MTASPPPPVQALGDVREMLERACKGDVREIERAIERINRALDADDKPAG